MRLKKMELKEILFFWKKKKVKEAEPLEAYETQVRKRPLEIIEGDDKNVEHIYIKLPSMNLIDISSRDSSKEHTVAVNDELVKRILKKYGVKTYSTLHTHPSDALGPAFPSPTDMQEFLLNAKEQTMYVAQRNKETGKVEGYICISKRKNWTRMPSDKVTRDTNIYDVIGDHGEYRSGLDNLARKYNLRIKYLPREGLTISHRLDEGKFIEKKSLKKRLENIVALALILGFLGSIFFLSSNITGNTIANLNQLTSNIIGGVLFVISLIVGFIWFNKR